MMQAGTKGVEKVAVMPIESVDTFADVKKAQGC
jgi:hypothetical protein